MTKWLRFFIFAASPLLAQNYTFEVASIKLSDPAKFGNTGITTDRAGFRTEGTNLRDLIQYALGVQKYQVTGVPPAMLDIHYDVTATNEKSEEAEIPETDRKNQEARTARIRIRVMNLLKERFQLQLREEKKELTVYALSEDKTGNKLKVAAVPQNSMSVSRSNAAGAIHAKGVSIGSLCVSLGGILERPMVEETGLTGVYDFELKYSADSSATDDANGPSLTTALHEQLGLKLTSKKAPVSIWVVEKAEKPGEN